MAHRRIPDGPRQDARRARAKTARRWALWLKLGLACAVATAIWQERALSPRAHDRMQLAAATVAEWVDNSDAAGVYAAALSGIEGGAGQSLDNPVTQALLNMSQ